MTYREKLAEMNSIFIGDAYVGGCYSCPDRFFFGANTKCEENKTQDEEKCSACWNQEIPENLLKNLCATEKVLLPRGKDAPQILDSGNRREFETGAVRDIQDGKGRCDLLPLDVVAWLLGVENADSVLMCIHNFVIGNATSYLYDAVELGRNIIGVDINTMILDLAKHFESGAKKYGERNWQKGIPVRCYIDSAVRHYLKFLRGDQDEPHDRAFVWNIVCAIWTCEHMPELNEYAREAQTDAAEQAYEQK